MPERLQSKVEFSDALGDAAGLKQAACKLKLRQQEVKELFVQCWHCDQGNWSRSCQLCATGLLPAAMPPGTAQVSEEDFVDLGA